MWETWINTKITLHNKSVGFCYWFMFLNQQLTRTQLPICVVGRQNMGVILILRNRLIKCMSCILSVWLLCLISTIFFQHYILSHFHPEKKFYSFIHTVTNLCWKKNDPLSVKWSTFSLHTFWNVFITTEIPLIDVLFQRIRTFMRSYTA